MSIPFVHGIQDFLGIFRGVPESVGSQVQRAREAAGYSPAELARLINLSPSMISRIEDDRIGTLTPDVFRLLCNALRSLIPVELAAANGYEVSLPPELKVPRAIAETILEMTEAQREGLLQLAGKGTAAIPPRKRGRK